MEVPKQKKYVDIVFNISLIIKTINALIEIIAGIFALFLTQAFLVRVAIILTRSELLRDPDDALAHYLLRSAQNFSSGNKFFILFYLLSHGIVKLALVIGLYKKKLWAYNWSFIVLGLFVIYQIYRYTITHSPWLILLTVLDIFIIWIIWKEYTFVKHTLT